MYFGRNNLTIIQLMVLSQLYQLQAKTFAQGAKAFQG